MQFPVCVCVWGGGASSPTNLTNDQAPQKYAAGAKNAVCVCVCVCVCAQPDDEFTIGSLCSWTVETWKLLKLPGRDM